MWIPDRLDFILRARVRGVPAVLGCVLAGALVASLSVFLLFGNARVSRVLFFPRARIPGIASEERLLPRHRSVEENVRELVEGLMLGPGGHELGRLFPKGSAVVSVLAKRGSLILDVSSETLRAEEGLAVSSREAFDVMIETILFNFPRLRDVSLFIDGQVPRFGEGKKS